MFLVQSEVDDSQDTLVEGLLDRLSSLAEQLGYPHDTATLTSCVYWPSTSDSLIIYYPVISLLISGHLYAEYGRLSGLLTT